ncbi:NAD-dependent epimerase/dehydratase family protein [Octadecabacter sp. CECT 8868]|uniref:NAD-dependent epimerase/dehydratase family protein n=1 Tax=Octadecabacter algicola TaxID=2909342 RepID=UPI001F434802|nr:NAD-dependent epimerase/dehydratase family protein [Octadecabacter algicola]MCF2903376.1 NAD-dependent epimerase/dehydratase family protein [Octadecabacter algicola]
MILVTGTTGLLGASIVRQLDAANRPYVSAAHSEVDLTDYEQTLEFFEKHKPEAVIHTAARVHGLMGNKRFPAEVFDDNISINLSVIKAAHAVGAKRFVAASTVAAYPGHLVEDIREEQYLNGPPHAGEAAYAASKRAMLGQLEAYQSQYGMSYAYAILTNLYGPGDRFDVENGHVIPSLVCKFLAAKNEGSAVPVWGRGRARRDFLYVEDAAAALVHMVDNGEGRINVATGNTLPIARVVEILSEVSGVTGINWEHDKPEGQLDRSYDVSRLRDIGFTHSWSLRDGLKATYDWYQENHAKARH